MCSAARGVSLLVTGIRSVRCDERSGQMHVNGSRMNMRSMWAKWGVRAHNVFPCNFPRWTRTRSNMHTPSRHQSTWQLTSSHDRHRRPKQAINTHETSAIQLQ